MTEKKDTYFAPAERVGGEEIKEQHALIDTVSYFRDLFNGMAAVGMVLNHQRQIVYANTEFLSTLGISDPAAVFGRRPGEVLSCVHAGENPNGCGTAEGCRVCDAVHAILDSQSLKERVQREARITAEVDGKNVSFDFMVTAVPIDIRGSDFTLVTLNDISGEKLRKKLERIFYHDIINTVGGLRGILGVLKEAIDPDETRRLAEMSEAVSGDLLDEIITHRQLMEAEAGSLKINSSSTSPGIIIKDLINKIRYHMVTGERTISVDGDVPELWFFTDHILLKRVLLNMVKNALEASERKDPVSVGCVNEGDDVVFRVHNRAFMPRDIQLQVFQRSFSTRGSDRGLGTYSMKLLAERYLGGRVYFTTSKEAGTDFYVRLPIVGPDS